MASAPNLRLTSSLQAAGNGPAAPVEAGEFAIRLATSPLTGQSGGSAQPSDGERDTQVDPTVVKLDSARTSAGPPAQDVLAGLIPIIQAQGDYPIAVTFAPADPDDAEAEATTKEDAAADPILSIVPTTPMPANAAPPAATIPIQPSPALPGTPGVAPVAAQPSETSPPEHTALAEAPEKAQSAAVPIAVPAGVAKKPVATPRPTEPQPAFRAAPEIIEPANGCDSLVKAAQAASLQAPAAPAAPAAAETHMRLQALRNALLPLGGAGARATRANDVRQPTIGEAQDIPQAAPGAARADAIAPVVTAETRPAATEPQAPAAPTSLQPAAVSTQRPAEPAQAIDRSIERALDLAGDSEWLDRLSRDIAAAGDRDKTLRFRLNPQTLGQLRVELSQSDQGATVRLAVETEAARALLSDAQPRLLAEARAQGVRIAEASVHLAGSDQHQSGDSRRQEDARQGSLVRTPSASSSDTQASSDNPERGRPGRLRSDRFA